MPSVTLMTKAERKERAMNARTFDYESENSEAQVYDALECECEPYVSVFTFKRWLDQGYAVRKGEKSHRIASYTKVTRKNKDGSIRVDPATGAPVTGMIPRTLYLFCKCQVEKIKAPK